MNRLKQQMIKEARSRYKRIHPCGRKSKLAECFTRIDDCLVFWFNTDDSTTHLLARPADSKVPSGQPSQPPQE